MSELTAGTIETLIPTVPDCMHRRTQARATRTGSYRRTDTIKPGEDQCQTAPKVMERAKPRDAQSATANLVSSGTTRGEHPFAPEGVSIASKRAGKLTATGAAAANDFLPTSTDTREGAMTFNISGRGKQYLGTARTLLRAAETMTDIVVAAQLKSLADDYQRRAEKASQVDAAKALARSAAKAEADAYDLIG